MWQASWTWHHEVTPAPNSIADAATACDPSARAIPIHKQAPMYAILTHDAAGARPALQPRESA